MHKKTQQKNQKQSVRTLINDVHNIDCVDLMRSMDPESVNMIFADPPFNLNKKYISYRDNLPFEEYIDWTRSWIAQACRILKPDGSIFVYNIPSGESTIFN